MHLGWNGIFQAKWVIISDKMVNFLNDNSFFCETVSLNIWKKLVFHFKVLRFAKLIQKKTFQFQHHIVDNILLQPQALLHQNLQLILAEKEAILDWVQQYLQQNCTPFQPK